MRGVSRFFGTGTRDLNEIRHRVECGLWEAEAARVLEVAVGTVKSPHSGSTYDRPGDEWGTGFLFDEPGCWHIHLQRTVRAGDVWMFRPKEHKTAHKGKARVVASGPKAQEG